MQGVLGRCVHDTVQLLRSALLGKSLGDGDSLGLKHGVGLGQRPHIGQTQTAFGGERHQRPPGQFLIQAFMVTRVVPDRAAASSVVIMSAA